MTDVMDDTVYLADIFNKVHLNLTNHRYIPAAKNVYPPFNLQELCNECFPPGQVDPAILNSDTTTLTVVPNKPSVHIAKEVGDHFIKLHQSCNGSLLVNLSDNSFTMECTGH